MMIILDDHMVSVTVGAFFLSTGPWYTRKQLFLVDRLHVEEAGRIATENVGLQTSPLPVSPQLADIMCHVPT